MQNRSKKRPKFGEMEKALNHRLSSVFKIIECSTPGCKATSAKQEFCGDLCRPCSKDPRLKAAKKQRSEIQTKNQAAFESKFGAFS